MGDDAAARDAQTPFEARICPVFGRAIVVVGFTDKTAVAHTAGVNANRQRHGAHDLNRIEMSVMKLHDMFLDQSFDPPQHRRLTHKAVALFEARKKVSGVVTK
jgi:hypothetical protein